MPLDPLVDIRRPIGVFAPCLQDAGPHSGLPYELAEQRMRPAWTRAEFRMELRSNEPGMILELDDLDQAIVGRGPREDHARLPHSFPEGVVELEAMAVPLVDHGLAVSSRRPGPRLELAG